MILKFKTRQSLMDILNTSHFLLISKRKNINVVFLYDMNINFYILVSLKNSDKLFPYEMIINTKLDEIPK